MCCFRKNKERELLLANKKQIQAAANQINVLIELAADNADIKDILVETGDKIKYFNPSVSKECQAIDNKIAGKIGDAKIALHKAANKDNYDAALSIVKELKILAVERENTRS